jgi:hypothetical protein
MPGRGPGTTSLAPAHPSRRHGPARRGRPAAGRIVSQADWSGRPENQPSGTSTTRVPQFCCPSVVWLDLGGTYSVDSHAASDPVAGTAKE